MDAKPRKRRFSVPLVSRLGGAQAGLDDPEDLPFDASHRRELLAEFNKPAAIAKRDREGSISGTAGGNSVRRAGRSMMVGGEIRDGLQKTLPTAANKISPAPDSPKSQNV